MSWEISQSFLFPYLVDCGTLFPWQGIEPRPLTVKARNPIHGTAREVPKPFLSEASALVHIFKAIDVLGDGSWENLIQAFSDLD